MSFNRTLSRALIADAREDVAVAMRVGVLAALDHKRSEIADRLELTPAQVRSAMERVKRASRRMG